MKIMINDFITKISLEGEIWKEIEDCPNYAVSNYGRVASLGKPIKYNTRRFKFKPKLLKFQITAQKPGYCTVGITTSNGHRITRQVHRLVACAFIPNPHNYPVINHKDENAKNNCVDNLEWCTQQYNCNYGTHNERMAKTISATAYQQRKVLQFTSNWKFIDSFNSIQEAAASLPCSHSTVSLCCRGKIDTGRGYHWIYQDDLYKYKDQILDFDNIRLK